GLEQGDLSVSEEPRPGTADVDRADRHTFSQQRDAQYRAVAHAPRVLAALGEFVHLGLNVGDVDRLSVENSAAIARPADQRNGGMDRDRAVMGDEAEPVALSAPDGGVERLAQAGGALPPRARGQRGRRAAR